MSNFNNTGEVKEISILDMMNGAIGERAAYELTRIMKNCRDFNTEAKKGADADHQAVHRADREPRQRGGPCRGEQQAGSGQADRRRTAARRHGRRTHRDGIHAAGARSAVVRPVR